MLAHGTAKRHRETETEENKGGTRHGGDSDTRARRGAQRRHLLASARRTCRAQARAAASSVNRRLCARIRNGGTKLGTSTLSQLSALDQCRRRTERPLTNQFGG